MIRVEEAVALQGAERAMVRRATRVRVMTDDPAADDAAAREARRGLLLAVCGLCGGAGASTLAYLTALAENRDHTGSVLVADTGGPNGGLACYAGVEAPRSLTEAAEHVAAGLPVGELVATTREGLRVLATGPRLTTDCDREGLELLLDHARDRYALTVIDCGTQAREADQLALSKASHVAWVLPATPGAVHRGRRVLEAIESHRPAGSELLVARRDEREPRAALRDLRRLAEHRRAPLILLPNVPNLPHLATGKPAAALEKAQVPLQAIRGVLAR